MSVHFKDNILFQIRSKKWNKKEFNKNNNKINKIAQISKKWNNNRMKSTQKNDIHEIFK